MKRLCFFLFFFLSLVFLLEAKEGERLEILLKKAGDLKLAHDPYWHSLYHYAPLIYGGVKSRIDEPDFFFSPRGKKDPEAEIKAAILALFSGEKEDLCPYIARYSWLYEKLKPESESFSEAFCKDTDSLSPLSLSLIFPSRYMNNPASIFGHTLLSFRMENQSSILDKALNYSAFTQETNGLFFAFKGIFGFYKGYFNVTPYYKKIQEYGEINQRDIWEYRLNFEPEELKAMVRHIRELERVNSDYYFFDENCSFNLLYILESGRPGLSLSQTFPLWVIPVDTIRLLEEEELISRVDYRPSRATIIKHRLLFLSEEDKKLALDILEGKKEAEAVLDLDKRRAILILDSVIDCIRYNFVKNKMKLKDYQKRLIKILALRSRLGLLEDKLPLPPPPARPESLHKSSRFSMGLRTIDSDAALNLSWRPAFTDLIDPDNSDSDAVRIVFLETNLTYNPSSSTLHLESLDFIDIVSISPRDEFFKPWSWALGFGLEGVPREDAGRVLWFKAGGGVSREYGRNLLYLLAVPKFLLGSELKDNHSAGAGLRAACIFRFIEGTAWEIFAEGGGFILGDKGFDSSLGFKGSLALSDNTHLNLSLIHKDSLGFSSLKTIFEIAFFY